MQRYTVYFSGNCSTCFGWDSHPSSGAQTTVSTASGICHTVMDRVKFTDKVFALLMIGGGYHPKYTEQFPEK